MFAIEAVTDEQITDLQTVERDAARMFVRQCEALLAVWDTTDPANRTGLAPQVLAEAGLALGLHPMTLDRRLGAADALLTHPLLRRLLWDGRLGVPHALVTIEEIGVLDTGPAGQHLAGQVLAAVLTRPGCPGWQDTPATLRVALRRALVRLDPEGAAARRHEQQQARTGIRLRALSDGLAALVATGPAGQLLAADRLLDLLSTPDSPADDRTRGQRQLTALLGALAARAGAAVPLELQLEIDTRVPVESYQHPGAPAEAVVIRSHLTPDLLHQLLHTSQQTPPEQTPPEQTQPEQRQPEQTQDSPGGNTAGNTAGRCRPRGGVPEIPGFGPVDAALLQEYLTDPAGLPTGFSELLIRRVCIDPHGQVVAVDDTARPVRELLEHPTRAARRRPGRPPDPAGTAPAPLDAAGLLTRLLSDLPQPPPPTDSYRPTAAQTRVVQTRDSTCCFPGCHRRARRCDLDHRRPHPAGATTVSNLHPLCRHHHRLKHDGWTCTRTTAGTTRWTSPRGQTKNNPPE